MSQSDQALSRLLLHPAQFDTLVREGAELVHGEIATRGLTLRSVFKLAERARPGLVEAAMRALLPAFARALDPLFDEFRGQAEARDFGAWLAERPQRLADALLGVTDRRIETIDSKALRGAYGRLRPRAEKEVMQAAPRIAMLIGRHAPD